MRPINNIPVLLQIVAWRRPGDKIILWKKILIILLTHTCFNSLGPSDACMSRKWILFLELFFSIVQPFMLHDDVIKWRHFPRYWPFVRGIHRSWVNSPHKGQWRGALMFSLICAWINRWANNGEAGDLRRYRTHYDVIVMSEGWLSDWLGLTIFFRHHCPFKPCNLNPYVGVIIFPHIDDTQSTDHKQL